MRVISGDYRGLKLCSPEGIETRPTLDRVKEAVFNMLMPYVIDADVLDIFAGSGAMGIEALSRGSRKAIFVDNNKNAIECIRKNVVSAKAGDRAIIDQCDALKFLQSCNDKYDLIFLDPPYFEGLYNSVLDLIEKNDILNENGLIIVEWDYENGFTDNTGHFQVVKEKKYGRVGITVLNRG